MINALSIIEQLLTLYQPNKIDKIGLKLGGMRSPGFTNPGSQNV